VLGVFDVKKNDTKWKAWQSATLVGNTIQSNNVNSLNLLWQGQYCAKFRQGPLQCHKSTAICIQPRNFTAQQIMCTPATPEILLFVHSTHKLFTKINNVTLLHTHSPESGK